MIRILSYLKCEGLIEARFKSFPMNLSLKLFLFVRQQIEFDIRIRAASHIHCR